MKTPPAVASWAGGNGFLFGLRHRALAWLLILVTLAPAGLLLRALHENSVAGAQFGDVNAAGSLRFRSLWIYGATQEGKGRNWRLAFGRMATIRDGLRVRYPQAVRETDPAWAAFADSLARTGRVDWRTADAMRVAADGLTRDVEAQARGQEERTSLLLSAGVVGIALSLLGTCLLIRSLWLSERRQARLTAVLDSTTDLIGIADRDGTVFYLNNAFRRFLGLATGAAVSTVRLPNDLAGFASAGEATWQGETAFTDASGRAVPMSQVLLIHAGRAGVPEYVSTIARDISGARQTLAEREQALADLQENQRLFLASINAMEEGFTVQDREGVVLMCNARAESILNIGAAALVGHKATSHGWRLLREDGTDFPRHEHPSRVALRTGQAQPESVFGFVRGDEPTRWLSMRAAPLFHMGEDKPHAVVQTFSDVTDRRRLEERLRCNEERLRMLHDLTATRNLSVDEKVERLLRLGCKFFGLSVGVLARIEDNRYEILRAVSQDNAVSTGLQCDTSDTFCSQVIRAETALAVDDIGKSSWRDLPAYAVFGLEAYLGAPLWVGERLYGTLCFASPAPRSEVFLEADKEILRLMAQWIGGELERRQAEEALRESKRFAESVAENSTSIIFVFDLETMTNTYANRNVGEFLGYPPEQVRALGEGLLPFMIHPDDLPLLMAHLAAFGHRSDGEVVEFEYRARHVSGEWRWIWNRETVFKRRADGSPWQILGTAQDVTERKAAEQRSQDYAVVLEFQKQELEKTNSELAVVNGRLEALATLDGLTGIKNRRAFGDRLEEEVLRATRYSLPLSLVLLDVDRFKRYNDTFGHPEGDEVLKQVARVLAECARETDLVARYGGEEFAVLLPQTDASGAGVIAERIRRAIAGADWPKRPVTASLGVSALSPAMAGSDELIARADEALYESKAGGRNRVTLATLDRPAAIIRAA